jgi:hypothetical protein
MVITCPYCGTNHLAFQSNCKNCGAPLPAPEELAKREANRKLVTPPPPPREISGSFAWRWLLSDGWSIVALVFTILGGSFTITGLGLIAGIITAIIGIPFALLGIAFLGGGIGVGIWRYQLAQNALNVLRHGQSTRGEITSVEPNYNVRVNGRHPWTIDYRFTLDGKEYTGTVTTLNTPQLEPGNPTAILYLSDDPKFNGIYPHP